MSELEEPREIDWSTAVVDDGRLSVDLTGEPSGRWSEHMQDVLTRLDPRRTGAIKVAKQRIKVSPVDAESADVIRHLLESAVRQTNADLVAPAADEPDAEASGADPELTETFRGFASG